MQFNRRNINKRLRNGDIISSSLYSTASSGGGSSSGGVLSGNYLPATQNPDGTYTVNLTQVNFNGNVIASGEVSDIYSIFEHSNLEISSLILYENVIP